MPNPSMSAWAEYAFRYGSTRHLESRGVLRPEAHSVAHIVDPPARLARGAIEQFAHERYIRLWSTSGYAGRYFKE